MKISYSEACQIVIDTLQSIEVKATEENLSGMLNSIQLVKKLKAALDAEGVPQIPSVPDQEENPTQEENSDQEENPDQDVNAEVIGE